jgi:rare lipoprotein A
MLRDTSPGQRTSAKPVKGSASRLPAGRVLWIGALWLAAGPLLAQTASLNTSTSLSEACSSAKAVHDMRCANYTGFKARLSARDAAPATADMAGEADAPKTSASFLPKAGLAKAMRVGRDLQRGVASWYGPGFHGRTTANGEKFDMYELTAAHKTLPFGTRVVVHNPRTGKEVVVRINDRGPYAKGRVIDLSKAAANALGFKARGHDAVVLREVLPGSRGDLVASTAAGE